jgi:hypothetical protein
VGLDLGGDPVEGVVVVVGAVERRGGRAVGVEAAERYEPVEPIVGVVGEQLRRRVGAGGEGAVVVGPGVAGDAGEVAVGVVPVAGRTPAAVTLWSWAPR